MMHRIFRIVFFLLIVTNFSCNNSKSNNPAEIIEEKEVVAEVAQVDLNVALQNLEGIVSNLQDYKGKVLFINFWATWCPPCRAEMPSIENLYNQNKDKDIEFLIVSLDHEEHKVVPYLEKEEYTFPVFFARNQIPAELYPKVLPTTFIIGKQGEVVLKHQGAQDWNTPQINDLLSKLVDK